jgi:hypothetical protein
MCCLPFGWDRVCWSDAVAEAERDGGRACLVPAGKGAAVVVADLAGGLADLDQIGDDAAAAGESAALTGRRRVTMTSCLDDHLSSCHPQLAPLPR